MHNIVSLDTPQVKLQTKLYEIVISTSAADQKKTPSLLMTAESAVTTQFWKYLSSELQISIITYFQQLTNVKGFQVVFPCV